MNDPAAIFTVLFLITGLPYTILILAYTAGWFSLQSFATGNNKFITKISVIVPARNEQDNIPLLLNDLKNLDYPSSLFEVIVIDDHSTDGTYNKVNEFAGKNKDLNINLSTLYYGEPNRTFKKNAISKGVEISTGELIVTTDADCRVQAGWLKTIAAFYEEKKCKMIIGPVVYHNEENAFQKMQSLEFMSLIAVTAGAAAIGKPIMSNGANFAYEKRAFIETGGFTKDGFSSGDDMFLMMKFLKKYGSSQIRFLKSREATVFTYAKRTFGDFIEQRVRWASKNKGFSPSILFVSVTVYSVNLLLVTALLFSFFNAAVFRVLAVAFIVKLIVDIPILTGFVTFVRKTALLRYLLPLYAVYPFYIVFSGARGIAGNYHWKGRKIKY